MANKRIKDLATTASSAASDDFVALDGATNGTRKMSAANPSVTTLTTSGVIAPGGSVHGANGSAANPSFAFNSDQNTGLYRIGADNIGVAANGAKVLDIATTGLTVTGALGASSLTSPASTNLTLGTGSYGTALTVASATGAATFAGAVSVGTGAAVGGATAGAGGLAFPAIAVGVADANTLDDYEEGTWTPTDNSGAALSFTVYNATYTKIGRAVEVEAAIYFPSTGSTAAVQIAGLPFTAAGGDDGTGGISFSATNVNLSFTGLILRANTNFVLELISGASVTNLNMSSKYIKFFGWYHV